MYLPERHQEVLGQAVVLSAVRKPGDGDDIGLKRVFNRLVVGDKRFVKDIKQEYVALFYFVQLE